MSESNEKKRISINTDLLIPSSSKRRKTIKKDIKEKKFRTPIKANSIKRELIKKIKQKQQIVENKGDLNKKTDLKIGIDENDFENDFMKSMHFLDSMIKEKKEKTQLKKTMKRSKKDSNLSFPQESVQKKSISHASVPQESISHASVPQASISHASLPQGSISYASVPQGSLHMQPILLPEPKYGCLRNGNKPCFREYHNKTLKKYEPQLSLKKKPRKTKIKKRFIKKRNYKVGKTLKNKTISVLIKNNQTRRRVQQDLMSIKKKSLSEIKKELYKKNLLKIGSSCPPDIIRTMYENTMLAGHINNTGKGVSIHNFINEEEN